MGAVQAFGVVEEAGEGFLGGAAFALGEEQVAYGAADFERAYGVVGVVLEVGEEGAVLLQGLGDLAELFEALGGLVVELEGLAGGMRRRIPWRTPRPAGGVRAGRGGTGRRP